MSLLRFFLGTVMLTTGRRLYWLFLGMLGFVFAFDLADRVIHGQPYDVKLVFAVAAGVLGAGLAIFLQKFAILASGFLAGGYLFVGLMRELGPENSPLPLASVRCRRLAWGLSHEGAVRVDADPAVVCYGRRPHPPKPTLEYSDHTSALYPACGTGLFYPARNDRASGAVTEVLG